MLDKMAKIISEEIGVEVTFKIESDETVKGTYEFTITFVDHSDVVGYIFLETQKSVLYYFPLPLFKKLASALKEYFQTLKIETTIKETACQKCLQFLRCRLNSPNTAQLEQIGCDTKETCQLFKLKRDREFRDNILKPIMES